MKVNYNVNSGNYISNSLVSTNNYEAEKANNKGMDPIAQTAEDMRNKQKEEGVIYTHTPMYKYDSKDGAVIVKVAANAAYENQNYQSKLSALGFYNGPIDGNINSSVSRSAISLFQKVYGVTGETGSLGSKTKSKIYAAYNTYNNAICSQGIENLKSTYKLDNTEKANVAKVWAFLRTGMGLTTKQSAGVMGNILLESRFASDNAQDSKYPKDHNSNYAYKANDNVAYGLIQWKAESRKRGLQSKANELGLSVSDLNAQLAYFKQEMTSTVNGNTYYKKLWEEHVINQTSVQDTCDAFRQYIEGSSGSVVTRRNNAEAIYAAFSAF